MRSVCDMFAFMKYDIDNERAKLTRSLAWRVPQPYFMLIYLTGLHALVAVAWKVLMPFVLCSVISFGLLYYCASNALLL